MSSMASQALSQSEELIHNYLQKNLHKNLPPLELDIYPFLLYYIIYTCLI